MSDNACETARHHELPDDCLESMHHQCVNCRRCLTCGELNRDAGNALASAVREWERNNPKAYGRDE